MLSLYLQFLNGNPAGLGEILQHRHQELQTAVPVAKQEHEADQVEDAHELACYRQKLQTGQTHLKIEVEPFS